ncbi:MAG: hypothetical protein RLN78_10195 [Phycisphaerales bacterium]
MLRIDRGLRVAGLIGTLIGVPLVFAGCMSPKIGFDSPAPNKRLDAIALAAQEDDQESLVQLVKKLSSHDPSERMLAIRALEKREGTTLGYDHAAPRWERLEAINKWRERVGLSDDHDDSADSPMKSK